MIQAEPEETEKNKELAEQIELWSLGDPNSTTYKMIEGLQTIIAARQKEIKRLKEALVAIRDTDQRFLPKCLRCGQCCKQMILEIHGVDIDREPRLAEYATLLSGQEDEPEAYKIYRLPSPCPLLTKDNKCSIYTTRPTACVAFGKGESMCGDPDAERCAEMRENA